RSSWSTSQTGLALLGFHVERNADRLEVSECVRSRLAEIARELPPDVTPPTIERATPGVFALVTLRASSLPVLSLQPIADRAALAIDAVPGIHGTRVCGPRPATWVALDPVHLRSLGVSTRDVVRALSLVQIGSAQIAKLAPPPIEEMAKTIVRASPEVRLRDVASVSAGVAPNGCRAFGAANAELIAIEVSGPGAPTDRLQEALAPLRSELPNGTSIEVELARDHATFDAAAIAVGDEVSRPPNDLAGVALIDAASTSGPRLSLWAPPPEDDAAWLLAVTKALGDPSRWRLTSAVTTRSQARPAAFALPRDASAACVDAVRSALGPHTIAGSVHVLGRDTKPERRIEIDRARAAQLGVSVADVAEVIRAGVAGMQIGATEPPLWLRLESTGSVDWIDLAEVAGQVGRVPLRSLVQETEAQAPEVLVRIDRGDVVVVRGLVPFGAPVPSADELGSEPALRGCGLEQVDSMLPR
ncbi:MAG: efflux RND transporter permease subunit, partial [Myxococcales bacterium]|nr:efflux RND transporter permease subunit [Myxococcales bacterium]